MRSEVEQMGRDLDSCTDALDKAYDRIAKLEIVLESAEEHLELCGKHKRELERENGQMLTRIVELEGQQDKQIVAVAEAVNEAREEGYAKCKADVLALPTVTLGPMGTKAIPIFRIEALLGLELER